MHASPAGGPPWPAGSRAAADRPPTPRRPHGQALAVVIHPAQGSGGGRDSPAPATGVSRLPVAAAATPLTITARSLRERTRRHCARASLALAAGTCFGYATGAFVLVGLDFTGYCEQDAIRWGVIAGAATGVVASALGWHALDGVDCTLAPAPDAPR